MILRFRLHWFAVIVLFCSFDGLKADFDPNTGGCASGWWGSQCQDECHCMSLPCGQQDGRCRNNDSCAPGWTKLPLCNTSCTAGTFGLRCAYSCHCRVGDDCNHVNGLCSSAACMYGWDGPGCQIRLPVFKHAPNISAITPETVTVTWRPWIANYDIGDPPIGQYTLEYHTKDMEPDEWNIATTVYARASDEPYMYIMTLPKLSTYHFRLLVLRMDNDKLLPAIPGPSTEPIVLCKSPAAPVLVQVLPEAVDNETGSLHIAWQASRDHGCESYNSCVIRLWCDNCDSRDITVPASFRNTTLYHLPVGIPISVSVYTVNDANLLSPPSNVIIKTIPAPQSAVLTTIIPTKPESSMQNLKIITKNDRIVELTFTDTATFPVQYKVTLNVIDTYLSSSDRTPTTLYFPKTIITLRGLLPSTKYRIVIDQISEAERVTDSISTNFWTVPAEPEINVTPSIGAVLKHEVVLEIPPVLILNAPLSRAFVLVQKVDNKTLMTAKDLESYLWMDYETAKSLGLSFYIAKEIPVDEIKLGVSVVLGENDTRLEAGNSYDIWLCIESSLENVTRKGCRKSQTSFTVTTVENVSVEKSAIIAVPLAILLLLAIALVLGYILYKRKCGSVKQGKFSDLLTYHRGKNLADIHTSGGDCSLTKFGKDNIGIQMSSDENSFGDYNKAILQRDGTVHNMEQYMKDKKLAENLLKQEFKALPCKARYKSDDASTAENGSLNRSELYVPYDKNRAQLPVEDREGTDYINASVVRAAPGMTYVVTQAPMEKTVNDFWLMVWHYQVERIVMLMGTDESLDPKCEPYWPESAPQTYGKFELHLIDTRNYAHYTVRVLELSLKSSRKLTVRNIYHYQYHMWSKPGDIPSSLTRFGDFMLACRADCNSGAMCAVHCEYGTGRSGMFVAIEVLMSDVMRQGKVSARDTVVQLRQERGHLVVTPEQYIFIHNFIVDAVLHSRGNFTWEEFKKHYDDLMHKISESKRSALISEFRALHRTDCLGNGDASFVTANQRFISPYNSPKKIHTLNAFHLKSKQSMELSFSEIDSYLRRSMLLVSASAYDPDHTPLLLKRLWDDNVTAVVTIGFSNESTHYWPYDGTDKSYDSVKLKIGTVSVMRQKDYLIRDLVLTKMDGLITPQRCIRQFQYTPWPADRPLPSVASILDLLEEVESWLNQSSLTYSSIYVQCANGFSRSGLFCVLWSVKEQMDYDGTINIFQTVKAIREANNRFIPIHVSTGADPRGGRREDQYRFCYRVVREMLKRRGQWAHSGMAKSLTFNETTVI